MIAAERIITNTTSRKTVVSIDVDTKDVGDGPCGRGEGEGVGRGKDASIFVK